MPTGTGSATPCHLRVRVAPHHVTCAYPGITPRAPPPPVRLCFRVRLCSHPACIPLHMDTHTHSGREVGGRAPHALMPMTHRCLWSVSTYVTCGRKQGQGGRKSEGEKQGRGKSEGEKQGSWCEGRGGGAQLIQSAPDGQIPPRPHHLESPLFPRTSLSPPPPRPYLLEPSSPPPVPP